MSDKSSRRPEDTAFKQQRIPSWQPILTPKVVIFFFIVVGIVFIPIGALLKSKSDKVVEYKVQYDGSGADSSLGCKITQSNSGKTCKISFDIDKKMNKVYVSYQLSNFYQNHRRYVSSISSSQLLGGVYTSSSDLSACDPLIKNGSSILSPCGLIANSLFNDVITLTSSDFTMTEDGIAWKSDMDNKFDQPDGFSYTKVANSSVNCKEYVSSPCSVYCDDGSPHGYETEVGSCYAYHYPYDSHIQYLYETFSQVVNPIDGVNNEHFIVWMRTAGLSTFRKLYGIIESGAEEGDKLEFNITNNFRVDSFDGKKWLVISTSSWTGSKNTFLGVAYITVGTLCLAVGIAILGKQTFYPRKHEDGDSLFFSE